MNDKQVILLKKIDEFGDEIPSGELFNSIVKNQLPGSKTEFSRNNFHTIINRLKNKGFLKTRSIKTIPPVSFISLTDLGRKYLRIFEESFCPEIKSEMNVIVPDREEIELSEDDKIELVERISSIIINDSLQKEYEDIDEKLARRIKKSAMKIIEKLLKELS